MRVPNLSGAVGSVNTEGGRDPTTAPKWGLRRKGGDARRGSEPGPLPLSLFGPDSRLGTLAVLVVVPVFQTRREKNAVDDVEDPIAAVEVQESAPKLGLILIQRYIRLVL